MNELVSTASILLAVSFAPGATAQSRLFGTTNQGELVVIDLDARSVKLVGVDAPEPGFTSLAFDAAGRLFAASRSPFESDDDVCVGSFSDGSCAHLYRIDPNTGAVIAELGSTGVVFLSDLDFAADGTLFGSRYVGELSSGDGGLVTVSTATGQATAAPNVRFGSGFEGAPLENGGLSVHPQTGELWGVESTFSSAPSLFRIDRKSGLRSEPVLRLAQFGVPLDFGFDALEILSDGRFLAMRGGFELNELYELFPASGKGQAEVALIALGYDADILGRISGIEAAAKGTVAPPSITSDPSAACSGSSEAFPVAITLFGSNQGAVDVFFLLDGTDDFALAGAGPEGLFGFIDAVQAALPDIDFAFGLGRFEDYGGPGASFSGGTAFDRPFVLNQALVRADRDGDGATDPELVQLLFAALASSPPGSGGDAPDAALEALFQIATGLGFDGDGNGDALGSGAVGSLGSQVDPGPSGDVPPFSADAYAAAGGIGDGVLGGVGFRQGALKIVALLTSACPVAAFPGAIPPLLAGLGGPEPVAALACSATTPGVGRFGFVAAAKSKGASEGVAPLGAAQVQATLDALTQAGIRVVGSAPGGLSAAPTPACQNPLSGPCGDARAFLAALARATGAVDASGAPLVFDPLAADPIGPPVAAIADLVQDASTAPVDVTLAAEPIPAGLSVSISPKAVGPLFPGDTASFVATFSGLGSAFGGGALELRFRDLKTTAVLGAIPVHLVCPGAECFLLLGRAPIHVPLPFSPQDVLLVLPELVFPISGPADTPVFQIPDDPVLLGVHLYSQVYMDNAGWFPSDPYKLSNGLDVTLGIGHTPFGPSTGMTLTVKQKPLLGGVLAHDFTIDVRPE